MDNIGKYNLMIFDLSPNILFYINAKITKTNFRTLILQKSKTKPIAIDC